MKTRRDITKLLATGISTGTVLLTGCTDVAQEIGLVEKEVGGPTGPAPRATFRIEYDADAETITAAHHGGARVPAANVYLRGSGLDQTGSWIDLGGDTTTIDGTVLINTGSELTVGATPAFSARLVWDTGDTTRTYAEQTGPDA